MPKLTIKTSKLIDIRAACLEISELQENATKLLDGRGGARTEKRDSPIKLSIAANYGLLRNLRVLDAIVIPLLEGKEKLVKQLSDNGRINLNSPLVVDPADKTKFIDNPARIQYLSEIEPMLDQEEEVDIYEIPISAFSLGDKPGQNSIPLRVLNGLGPILKLEEPKLEKTDKVDPK